MSYEKIIDHRPWGKFTQYTHNQKTTVKIIEVEPQQKLSTQRHQSRDELWIPLDQGLYALIGDETIRMLPNHEYYILRGTVHNIQNLCPIRARFLEIAFGHFNEDDIERLDDKYGRI